MFFSRTEIFIFYVGSNDKQPTWAKMLLHLQMPFSKNRLPFFICVKLQRLSVSCYCKQSHFTAQCEQEQYNQEIKSCLTRWWHHVTFILLGCNCCATGVSATDTRVSASLKGKRQHAYVSTIHKVGNASGAARCTGILNGSLEPTHQPIEKEELTHVR